MLVEKKVALSQNGGNMGHGGHSVIRNYLQRFWLAMKAFKGKREVISVNLEVKGQIHETSPTVCRLVGVLWSFFDVVLFTVCSHSLSVRLLKGKMGKRSCHLLITHFFLLWSMGKSPQVRQDVVWPKYLKSVLGPKVSRAAWGYLVQG